MRHKVTPNLQFHRSVNSRLRRLSPPGELGRFGVTATTVTLMIFSDPREG